MPDSSVPADAELQLNRLPALPQARTIRVLAPQIWRDGRVVALWLGGSFGSGTADLYNVSSG